MLVVKKFGGSSVSDPAKIRAIARRLKKFYQQGRKLVVIVSAMGDTTDDLVQLSLKITKTPAQRELDMLLSAGERITMALMSMALHKEGVPAISFTGSQSGIMTDGSHSNARIDAIKPVRVEEELNAGRVVIIAGFQGVNPKTKEITTLGRGGSDTSAVAMACHFRADQCDILKDVPGLFSIDPRLSKVRPRFLKQLSYDQALEMTYWGAQVLHYRCVELAERHEIPLHVGLSSEKGPGTFVNAVENLELKAVNYDLQVGRIQFAKTSSPAEALDLMFKRLEAAGVAFPQIIYQSQEKGNVEIFFSAPLESFKAIEKALQLPVKNDLATVTLTGRGLVQSNTSSRAAAILGNSVKAVIFTPLSLSFIVPRTSAKAMAQSLHIEFVEKNS